MGSADELYPAWAASAEDVAAHFGVDVTKGLSDEEVARQREVYGLNELDHEPPTPLWKLVLQQFDDTLVKILLLAAAISFTLALLEGGGEESEGLRAFVEPGVIILILVLNAVVGVWQENNAESALDALKEMSAETAKVFRNGMLIPDLPCKELVPGDVVEVHTGDLVPADLRLASTTTALFKMEQAALTGESVAVSKSVNALLPGSVELQAKVNCLFSGTGVAGGSGLGVVYATGMRTEIGRIQASITAAAAEDDDTPLKKKLDEFGEALARVILWICVAVWLINYRHFMSWKMLPGSAALPDLQTLTFSLAKATFYFKVAVALAVAAIPEGLPAVITTCLALGTRKMARRNAIVRKLPSVETLGCTTVICSDKTGTLTTNQMSAVHVTTLAAVEELRDIEVTGTSYDPADGAVLGVDELATTGAAREACLEGLAATAGLCNGARLARRHGHVVAVGQPTEAALLVLGEKISSFAVAAVADKTASSTQPRAPTTVPSVPSMADVETPHLDGEVTLPGRDEAARFLHPVATLEFDRDRKSMSVLCQQRRRRPRRGVAVGAGGAARSYARWLTAGSGSTAPAAGSDGSVVTGSSTVRRSARLRRQQQPSSSDDDGAAAGMNNDDDNDDFEGRGNVLLVKGAAECVLARCDRAMLPDGTVVGLSATMRTALEDRVAALARRALRLLVLAARWDLPAELSSYDGSEEHPGHAALADAAAYADVEAGLCFLGLVALRDPPRPEVASAMAACRAAGISTVVITGDNKLTAETICRDIGVFTDGDDGADRSLTGMEFAALDADQQTALLTCGRGVCISRAEPGHKQDIVRRLREAGEVTAMTGDGVNDAPALKLADIGIAMGITGTEVAKEAADMVLADDNFASVVSAVEEGRAIFNNMKAFIRYMISSNIGEVASIFLSAALGLPEGLIPVQLLWVNLVTDGPPATALGFNPPDPDIMAKPPRRGNEHFLTPWLLFRWLVVGCYVGCATVGVFVTWYTRDAFLGGLIDLSGDGHTPITLAQLRDWEHCPQWQGFAAANYTTAEGGVVSFAQPCDYFTVGKTKAATLSLSVLVAIEMFNAANALSEDNSLLSVPIWVNPWLLMAMAISFGLHFLILYVPFLAETFSIVPLSLNEWLLVLAYSLPVILIDEVLKFIGRTFINKKTAAAEAQAKDKHV